MSRHLRVSCVLDVPWPVTAAQLALGREGLKMGRSSMQRRRRWENGYAYDAPCAQMAMGRRLVRTQCANGDSSGLYLLYNAG
jgi:hypothetical protein